MTTRRVCPPSELVAVVSAVSVGVGVARIGQNQASFVVVAQAVAVLVACTVRYEPASVEVPDGRQTERLR